jgi:hypothetical protein
MFENIGRYAETMVSVAGQSRRGFLGLTGKGALSLASLVGGLLLFRGEALAVTCSGACRYKCPNGGFLEKGCSGDCDCTATINHGGMTCNLFSSNCLHR